MNGADPRRREALLELAEQLAKRLRSVQVPHLADPSALSIGLPASIVSHATSYLARARDTDRFREFLARFDQLDTMTAQNPDNPKADHRVLREELEALLADRPDLSAEELLYVLSWVRRLLPKAPDQNGDRDVGAESGNPGGAPEKVRNGGAPPIRGGQLAAAFQRARREAARESGGLDGSPGNKSRR